MACSGSPNSSGPLPFLGNWRSAGAPGEWRGDQRSDFRGKQSGGHAGDIPPRIGGLPASSGLNWISSDCERRCGLGIFAHDRPGRRHRDDDVRCGTVRPGALRGNGYQSRECPGIGWGRRAEERYGPCCTRATHIAASPVYQLGEYSRYKGTDRPRGWLADCGPRGAWPPANSQGRLEDCRRIGTRRPSCQIRPFRILWLARLLPKPPRMRIVLSRL